ncbi:MAG: trypsin-like peptidase domain-containing protein [Steroidobacteraceae bacterium]
MPSLPAAAKFIAKWTVVGLAAAFVLVMLRPQWLFGSAIAPPPPTPAASAPLSFADAVARTAPAVVNIFTYRVVTEPAKPNGSKGSGAAQRRGVETGLGSGVIVDTEGHVITNNHVVAGAQQIYVLLADGRSDKATVVGTDPATDLALLQIHLLNPPAAPLGESDGLRTGDIALAIGTPYGLSQTVTQGIVSAIGRVQLCVTAIEGFIQTDAAINEGNSGGALINAKGELIGINTAALSQRQGVSGISFAIPVNLVRGVMAAILQDGRVKRGWFGVETAKITVTKETVAMLRLSSDDLLVIKQVYPGSPAAAAGLQPGDIITRINGVQRSLNEALAVVANTPPGEKISLTVLRDRSSYDLSVTLVERQPGDGVSNLCSGGQP